MKTIFSQGPCVTLRDEEIRVLKETGYHDFDFDNINGVLRISIVDKKISSRRLCEPGTNVRRYPEKISPYDYKGKQLWVIRLSRERFEESLNAPNSDGMGITGRCKYDRFNINYFQN